MSKTLVSLLLATVAVMVALRIIMLHTCWLCVLIACFVHISTLSRQTLNLFIVVTPISIVYSGGCLVSPVSLSLVGITQKLFHLFNPTLAGSDLWYVIPVHPRAEIISHLPPRPPTVDKLGCCWADACAGSVLVPHANSPRTRTYQNQGVTINALK